jgi:hypothetical protein
MKADKSIFFNGLMIGHELLGYDFKIGHQFVRKPFKEDNPCHSHNFQEFRTWYGGNPDDHDDFQAEIVFCLGKEFEKHILTRPTIISIPSGLPHHPFEITRVDSPIIQIEIMIGNMDVVIEPYLEKEKGYNPMKIINREVL